jgi:D-arabinose 1-dehydrogenase-like Zn-dependent alcohol dehydrogenase
MTFKYFVCDPGSAIHLPDSLSFEHAAPLFCAGATIYAGIKKANLKKGDVLGIAGLGALGHLGVQFAKCMVRTNDFVHLMWKGLTVVGIDSRKEPLELTKSLKYTADLLIDSSKGKETALEEIKKLKKNSIFPGLDAVVIATGANEAFEFGADLLAKHGTLVVVGQPPKKIEFTFYQFIFRDIKVVGSLLSDAKTCQEMVNMVAEKGIEVKTKVPLFTFSKLTSVELQIGPDQ